MATFSSSRLRHARARRRRRVADLAAAAGVSPGTISNYQTGATVPDEETLARIAAELDYPVDFFRRPEIETLEKESASFRSLSRLRASDRDAALAAGQLAVLISDWMDAGYELPRPLIPDHHGADPNAAAHAVRTSWGLGAGPVADMVGLLEGNGARVFSLREDTSEMDAFCFWQGPTPFVLLNGAKSGERSRFDAAHELAHLVLHRRTDISGSRTAEKEATEFASAFLMPAEGFLASAPRSPSLDDLLEVKKVWRVSVAAAAVRLHRLGRITEWHYTRLFRQLSARGWRTSEPSPIARETSRVFPQIASDLRARGLSVGGIGEALGVPPAEVRALTFGLVEAGSSSESLSVPELEPTQAVGRGRAELRVLPGGVRPL